MFNDEFWLVIWIDDPIDAITYFFNSTHLVHNLYS